MTFTVMLFVSSAFAAITLTIKNADGTPAPAAVVYTLSSTDGTETIAATADGSGVATWNPAAGKRFYLIRNSGNTTYASYSVDYDGVSAIAATILLGTPFTPTMGSYTASRTGDRVTIGKTMPFWVYPSPIHNPSYTAPAAPFATIATIDANLSSSFAWTKTGNGTLNDNVGGSDAANNNYVEVNTTGATDGDIIALQVIETPSPSYGGCAAPPVFFNFEAINPPYARITNTNVALTYKISGVAVKTILSGCTPSATTNVAVGFSNAKELAPYYLRLTYTAQNGHINTLDATDIILDAPVLTFPAGKEPIGQDGLLPSNQTTNPCKFNASGNLYAADLSFSTLNDKITVYKFDLGSWNASVSRKSDYKALSAPLSIATSPYTWYTAVTSGQPGADITVAYIIVFPKPVTGPIYHIPTSFGNI